MLGLSCVLFVPPLCHPTNCASHETAGGQTATHSAAASGVDLVLAALIEHGADANVLDDGERTFTLCRAIRVFKSAYERDC